MAAKISRGDRRDGVWLRDLDPMHGILPLIYPNRADNEAFIQERIDLTNLNAYLAKKTESDPEFKYTYLHAFVAALVRTITLRPKMNRFISGGRIYQRNHLAIGFTMKKSFEDDAHEALWFRKFGEGDNIDKIHYRLKEDITALRKAEVTDNTTDAMAMLLKLPRWILKIVMGVLFYLDKRGKVPYDLIKEDPNYATVFLTNLGSIGLKAGYHHLSNWGTCSIFVVLGEKYTAPVYDEAGNVEMREFMDVGITLDERIADGFYYSKTIKILKHLLQNPQLLEQDITEAVSL